MKRCTKCGELRALTEFHFKDKGAGRQRTACRACVATYGRTYYLANRPYYSKKRVANMALYRKRNRALMLAHLLAHPCVDCGEGDICVLEFDHVRGAKKRAVSDLVRDGVAPAVLQAEIEKCEVRCANCHRRKTARDHFWLRESRERVAQSAEQAQTLLGTPGLEDLAGGVPECDGLVAW